VRACLTLAGESTIPFKEPASLIDLTTAVAERKSLAEATLPDQFEESSTMAVKAIPEGYSSLTPYLVMKNAGAAIDFYKSVFGATERMRMPAPEGKIGHAELQIGDSVLMMADEHPQMGFVGPETIGGTPVSLMLYVEDVDGVWSKAIAAGSKELRPVQNQFYGDRTGTLQDPFGHVWTIGTHVEDVSPEEMERRAAEMGKQS
jgi:PhnB protein